MPQKSQASILKKKSPSQRPPTHAYLTLQFVPSLKYGCCYPKTPHPRRVPQIRRAQIQLPLIPCTCLGSRRPERPRGVPCFLDVLPCVHASWFGGGWVGGGGEGVGGYDKHTRSTAADQPSFTGLKNNMLLGGGGGGGGWGGGGHDKHTRSTAADASFTPEAFTGPTFGSRTMGHHVVFDFLGCVRSAAACRVCTLPHC